MRRGQFRTKNEAMNRRKLVWVCQDRLCNTWHETIKPGCCTKCGHDDFHYFPSKAEAKRYANLLLMLDHGLITKLGLQQSFPVKINGLLITTYRCDFTYTTKAGEEVIEDVKPKGFSTAVFKLKKKMVEAQYGIKITLYET